MISSKEILQKTGLKSTKTLTRWHKQGIIPKPFIGTHPSGKGKMAYWDDSVMNRCLRIVELRGKGYSLGAAVAEIDHKNMAASMQRIRRMPSVSEILAGKKARLKDGTEVTLLDVFLYTILSEIEKLGCHQDTTRRLISKMREIKVLDLSFALLNNGYNPVLLHCPDTLLVMPDFMVSHYLSSDITNPRCFLTIPLIPGLRKAFGIMGKEFTYKPSKWPVQKILAQYGDALVERYIFLVGPDRFELIDELPGTTVGKIEKPVTKSKEEDR
jgi:hypothetical protein